MKARHRLCMSAFLILLILSIIPATGWLVRLQSALCLRLPVTVGLEYLMGDPYTANPAERTSVRQTLRDFATLHPDDFAVQLAASTVTAHGNPFSPADAIRPLLLRFANRPSLYANALRWETLNHIHLSMNDNIDIYRYNGDQILDPREKKQTSSSSELTWFDRLAADGERLDADNAYFPFMRAIGLFAARHDAEALKAIRRASQKTHWTEYDQDETMGQWRLFEGAFGNLGAASRVCMEGTILYTHYGALRSAARVAIYCAVRAEVTGHVEEGFQIRRSLLRCSSLMSLQSNSYIGVWTGGAISAIALKYPAGAEQLWIPYESNEARNRRTYDIYADYLRQIGHANEIRSTRAEIDVANPIRAIHQENVLSAEGETSVLWWLVDLSLLSNALWMLVLGAVAALLSRSRRLRTGAPVPDYVRWGITAGTVIAVGIALTISSDAPPGLPWLMLVSCCLTVYMARCRGWYLRSALLAITTIALAFIIQQWSALKEITILAALCVIAVMVLSPGGRPTRNALLRSLGVTVLTVGAWIVFGALLYWQEGFLVVLAHNFSPTPQDWGYEPLMSFDAQYLLLVAPLVPILALLVLGSASLLSRVPLWVGLVRGLRWIAIPIACVLFLVYGVLVFPTLWQEARVDEALQRTLNSDKHHIITQDNRVPLTLSQK